MKLFLGLGPLSSYPSLQVFFFHTNQDPHSERFWKIFYVNKLRHCIDHIRFRYCKQVKTQTCTFKRFKSHYEQFRKSFWGGLSNSAESRGEHDVSWPQIKQRPVDEVKIWNSEKMHKKCKTISNHSLFKNQMQCQELPSFCWEILFSLFQKLQVPKLDDFQCFRCFSTGNLHHLFAWDSPANPW